MTVHWFRAKRYGWGWYPASWQGWIVLLLYCVLIFIGIFSIDDRAYLESSPPYFFIGYMALCTSLLILICYLTGERPRWRWGD